MSNQAQPLAWSQAGEPIELPPAAVLWRVRRLNAGSKGGAPEIVYGADGLPLTVDIASTPADFAEAVERRPAKYRLDALDENKKAIGDVPPAYVVVGGNAARGEPAAEQPPGEIAVRTWELFTESVGEAIAELPATLGKAVAIENNTSHVAMPPPRVKKTTVWDSATIPPHLSLRANVRVQRQDFRRSASVFMRSRTSAVALSSTTGTKPIRLKSATSGNSRFAVDAPRFASGC